SPLPLPASSRRILLRPVEFGWKQLEAGSPRRYLKFPPSRQPSCPSRLAKPLLASNAAFDQFPWIFHCDLLEKVSSGVPNDHAHLSEFSWPFASYHAFKCGSVTASDSSWPLTLASASSPCECVVDGSSESQPASPSRL